MTAPTLLFFALLLGGCAAKQPLSIAQKSEEQTLTVRQIDQHQSTAQQSLTQLEQTIYEFDPVVPSDSPRLSDELSAPP